MRAALLCRLGCDERGATIVEFAMVAPVMALLLLAGFDVAHTLYMRGALQGVVQKAARDATLEAGLLSTTQTALDKKVKDQVRALANNGVVLITRKYYRTFSAAAVAQYEPFTDTNKNGTCDPRVGATPGEPYEDTNGNGRWDRTWDNSGQGGAKDAVVYTVSVTYPNLFPVQTLIGKPATTTVTASTVLRNQPYGDQPVAAVRNCPA